MGGGSRKGVNGGETLQVMLYERRIDAFLLFLLIYFVLFCCC